MSSETIDPIELLRDYMIEFYQARKDNMPIAQLGKKIVLETNKVLAFHQYDGIGEGAKLRLELETPTAWKKDNTSSTFCTIGQIWCFLAHPDLKFRDYSEKTKEIGVPMMQITSKRELMDYFTGVKSESSFIDVQMRTQTLLSKNDLK